MFFSYTSSIGQHIRTELFGPNCVAIHKMCRRYFVASLHTCWLVCLSYSLAPAALETTSLQTTLRIEVAMAIRHPSSAWQNEGISMWICKDVSLKFLTYGRNPQALCVRTCVCVRERVKGLFMIGLMFWGVQRPVLHGSWEKANNIKQINLQSQKSLLPDLHLQSWVMEKEDGLVISSNSPGAIKWVCCDEGWKIRLITDSSAVSGSLLWV